MVRQTSLLAYQGISSEINEKQREVLQLLKNSPFALTNKDIGRALRWSINTVTPRVLELRLKGRLLCAGVKVQDGRKAYQWEYNHDVRDTRADNERIFNGTIHKTQSHRTQ